MTTNKKLMKFIEKQLKPINTVENQWSPIRKTKNNGIHWINNKNKEDRMKQHNEYQQKQWIVFTKAIQSNENQSQFNDNP